MSAVNSAISSAAGYLGRTYDVLAFQGAQASGDIRLSQTLAGPGATSGEICTGAQKLAQRWLIEFLTISGGLQYLPDRGCPFMQLLQTGQLNTVLDAEQAFYLSAQTVGVNLQAEETGTEPADERFASADLLSLTVSGDTLTVSVQINSAAGVSRTIILPIPVTVSSGIASQ